MEKENKMRIVLFSFGYKYGCPVDVNFLIDVRSLPNPYWVDELCAKSGLHEDVAAYVLESEEAKEMLPYLSGLVQSLINNSERSGKDVCRIGVGCTGGRHRSVAVAEELGRLLGEAEISFTLFHRDIRKDQQKEKAL